LSAPTSFTDLIGCHYPVQLASMTRVVTPALAAGVSNLGGLGMLAIGRTGAAATRKQIDAALALTDRPIGAGFIVQFLERAALEEAAARLPVIEFFWGWPDADLVPDGTVTGWQVGSVDEAKAAADAGCAYVVAQGTEGGGHSRGTTPLVELLPAVLDAIDVPVLAAGGIGSADAVRQAVGLGAAGVRIGTRFVATVESDAHPRYVEHLVEAEGAETEVTTRFDVGWPDAPARVLSRALVAAEQAPDGVVATMTAADGSAMELVRWSTTPPNRSTVGNIDAMALYAGTSVTSVTGRPPVADVFAELIAGFED
jgi:NAD(P)H-dependent flavin oxidoreductase YrpB (nitropropane dioxygenase family)